jgi:hypothetical protein
MANWERLRRRRLAATALTAVLALTALAAAGSGRAGTLVPAALLQQPRNVSPPTIIGTPQAGNVLTLTTGAWTSPTPITSYSYQWQRCNQNGNNCTDISGATSNTYVVQAADVGHRLQGVVRAANAFGSNPATALTGTVAPGPPHATAAPTISGLPIPGQTLTADNGSWQSSTAIRYGYQWQRCDPNGNNCADIRDATGRSYAVSDNDRDHTLRVIVRAANAVGTTSTASNHTSVVGSLQPVLTAPPVIFGTTKSGYTLSVTTGTWVSATPLTYRYQWQRCDRSGNNCTNIPGAGNPTYTATTGDIGSTLRAVVRAGNNAGSNPGTSKQTAVIASGLPAGGIRESNNHISVPVETLSPPDRLRITKVRFAPRVVHSRTIIIARFHIVDTRGYDVRGALVNVVPLPYSRVTHAPAVRPAVDGWATLQFRPGKFFPVKGYIVFFVRARKPTGDPLGGISTGRLAQIRIRR